MRTRIPFAVTVVGALLVGGATTGTTRASWSEQVPATGDSITVGTMGLTAPTVPAALPALSQSTASVATTTFAVTDSGTGKNLRQQVSATVTAKPLNTDVTVQVGTSCTTGGATSAAVVKVPTDLSHVTTFCVRVTSSPTAQSGNVVLDVLGRQLPAGGWTVGPYVVTIPVTVSAGSVLSCPADSTAASGTPLSWTTPSGASAAQLQYQVENSTTWVDVPNATTSPVNVIFPKSTRLYRVRFTGGPVLTSNTVRVIRDNNGNNNMTCAPVVNP